MRNKEAAPDPYAAAKARLNDRYLILAKARGQWQVLAILLAAISLILAIGFVRVASTALVVPYVVSTDDHGQALFLGAAEQVAPTDQRLLAREVANLIVNLRTISTDNAVNRSNLIRAYAHLTGTAEAYISRYLANPGSNPLALSRTTQRVVSITSSLPIDGTHSWAVAWTETTTDPNLPPKEEAWTATLTITRRPPTNDFRMLRENPLGVFIEGLTWSLVSSKTP